MQPISTMRSPASTTRPVVSVSRKTWRMASRLSSSGPGLITGTAGTAGAAARRVAAEPPPQARTEQHHRQTQPLPHAEVHGQKAEESIGLAEVFDDEAQQAVEENEGRSDLAARTLLAAVDPQQREEQQPFERELV